MVETDLAYAAGLIDGEGCIIITRSQPHGKLTSPIYNVSFQITMTDQPTVDWFASLFDCRVHCYESQFVPHGKKRAYKIEVRSRKAVQLLSLVRPYLRAKARQADLAIAFQAGMKESLENPIKSGSGRRTAGHRLTDEEIARRNLLYEQMKALNDYRIIQKTDP